MGFFGLLVGLIVSGCMAVGLAVAMLYPNLPDVSELSDYHPKLPLRVYSADEVLLG